MVMMVLWGHISPQLMNKVMNLLHADLMLYKDRLLDVHGSEKLTNIGSKGAHPQHMWRDFQALLPKPKLGKLFRLMVPMKHNTLGKFMHSVPMLLPHTLFAGIYEHYPLMWEKIIYGSLGTCRKFWAAVRGSPQFAAHPVRHRVGFEEKCIPLKIHGDGTPVTGLGKGWGKMIDITSVSSLLICGPTILRNLMIFMMFQHLICRDPNHCTLDTFYRMLIWSFKWCWLGKKPTHDWNDKQMSYPGAGDDLCGGYYFAVWALIQDLEHAYSNYDMPNPTANACCPLYPVGLVPGLVWFDFRPNAAWLEYIYTIQSWLARGLKSML
jgi:hypothetical protein